MSFLTSLFRSAPRSPTFAQWASTTTQADIQTLFLSVLLNGDAETGLSDALSPTQLSHFNACIAPLAQSGPAAASPDLIPIQAFLQALSASHPRHARAITSASHLLTRLLQAHAAFPFAPDYAATRLPADALLRATVLLTCNPDKLLGAAGWAGDAVTVRKRSKEQRVGFVFRSLVGEGGEVGKGAQVEDVLDVLCRVGYPRVKDSSGDLARRDVADLVPVARRLVGDGWAVGGQGRRVAKETLEVLGGLVADVNGRGVGGGAGMEEGMNEEEFISWAGKVNLLGALDELFQVFLQD